MGRCRLSRDGRLVRGDETEHQRPARKERSEIRYPGDAGLRAGGDHLRRGGGIGKLEVVDADTRCTIIPPAGDHRPTRFAEADHGDPRHILAISLHRTLPLAVKLWPEARA